MLNRTAHFLGDSESLQTDVMRFLAIIAFCLIAVLALVRSAPAPVAEITPPKAPRVAVQSAPDPTPATPESTPASAETPTPAAEPPAASAMAAEPPTPAIESSEPAAEVFEPVEPSRPLKPPPRQESVQQIASEAPVRAPVDRPAKDEPGLTLRFASDSDFLRLVARGEIAVYAFAGSDVLRLDESYRFIEAPAPGQVYELLPGSVPSLIGAALQAARGDVSGYRWGIALPGRMRQRIEQLVNRVERGQLVIDRYGEVHHVAAS